MEEKSNKNNQTDIHKQERQLLNLGWLDELEQQRLSLEKARSILNEKQKKIEEKLTKIVQAQSRAETLIKQTKEINKEIRSIKEGNDKIIQAQVESSLEPEEQSTQEEENYSKHQLIG